MTEASARVVVEKQDDRCDSTKPAIEQLLQTMVAYQREAYVDALSSPPPPPLPVQTMKNCLTL
jgi:hypothetical protein